MARAETAPTGDGAPSCAPCAATEVITITHGDQVYELPAALRPALLMQADYTRKCQALARGRAALAARERALEARLEAAAVAAADLILWVVQNSSGDADPGEGAA